MTFTGLDISDPDGDALTYAWTTSDNAPATSSTPALAHVFAQAGTFDVRLTVTDSKGNASSKTASVIIRSMTGTWDIECDHATFQLYPNFPRSFVAVVTQSGAQLFGTVTGGGLSQTFPAPSSAQISNGVANPRGAGFGFESFYNKWAPNDGDFYFHLSLDETLTVGTGNSIYCSPNVARRR
jgi:PKD repeat protein